MFALSPKQDLVLLAAKHNNPTLNWNQISRKILSEYGEFIPTQLCCQRYESFLKFAPAPQSISALSPYELKPEPIEPSNFIFSYRELKRLASCEQSPALTCFPPIVSYQKRILRDLLFSSRENEKLIYKMRKSKQLSESQQNYLINNVYKDIRKICYQSERLTKSRAEELIEQIISDIIDKLLINRKRRYYDGKQMAKLMRCNGLIQQRRQILDIYYERDELSEEDNVLICSLLQQIINLYKYQHLQTQVDQQNVGQSRENPQHEDSQKGQEAFNSIPDKEENLYQPIHQIIIPIYQQQNLPKSMPQISEIQEKNMSTDEIKLQAESIGQQTETDDCQSIQKTVRLQFNTNNIQIAYAPNNQSQPETKIEAVKIQEVKVQSVKTEEIKQQTVKEEETRVRYPRKRKVPINVGKVWIVLTD